MLSKSTLDASAAEFIPSKNSTKQSALNRLRDMVEPIFESNGKNFQSQLNLLYQVVSSDSVNSSRLVGEILSEAISINRDRSSIGFRFFMKLRSIVLDHQRTELDAGFIDGIYVISNQAIAENNMQTLFTQSVNQPSFNSAPREEAGDALQTITPRGLDRLFGVLSILRLLITRLNSSDADAERICPPPSQPCVNLCQVLDGIFRMQLNYDRSVGPDDSDPRYDPMTIFSQNDWIGLVYFGFEVLSQCLTHINCLLANINTSILNGSWSQNGNAGQYEVGAQLSTLWSAMFSNLRTLLIDEKLPLKLLRSAALQLLLSENQLSNFAQSSLPASSDSFDSSTGYLDDEATESYEQFLKETNQFNPC